MNPESPHSPKTGTVVDPLAEMYLALSEKHKALLLESEFLKTEVEFVIRHLQSTEPMDKSLRTLLVTRLQRGLHRMDSRSATKAGEHPEGPGALAAQRDGIN